MDAKCWRNEEGHPEGQWLAAASVSCVGSLTQKLFAAIAAELVDRGRPTPSPAPEHLPTLLCSSVTQGLDIAIR